MALYITRALKSYRNCKQILRDVNVSDASLNCDTSGNLVTYVYFMEELK